MKKYWFWLLAFGSFVLPLGLYLKTLSPTYIPVDSAEFALCMHTWGMCHPPGFPLYVFVGHIFLKIFPFGSVIFEANLFSAVFGAGTIFLIYLTLVELKVKEVVSFLIALILAVSAAFWEFSVSADVFTFATFLIALTFYLAFKKRFLLSVFALGLSASHFYISAVLAPIIYFYFVGFKFKLKHLLYSTGVFALGFFPQGLMYWRMQQSPEINWGHAQGVSGFVDYLRRKEFGNIFLLANTALKFSIIKFLKHIWIFLVNIFTSFGIVLPVLVIVFGFLGLFRNKKYLFLGASFLVIIIVQLFLLSTIDPTEADSPFQISKFYLAAFVPAVLMFGMSFQKIVDKIFEGDTNLPALLLGFLLVLYLVANFKASDLSKVYFSQNLVFDALGQLPSDSVAITVSHVMNFGTRYEQIVNGKFQDITILYFPNENNFDNESYYPSLFNREINQQLIEEVAGDQNLGKAERYILETISRNMDKKIYILQGGFEEKFFLFMKPYLQPHGLWWKVDFNRQPNAGLNEVKNLVEGFRNEGVTYDELHNPQQKNDVLHYAVSYHSTAIWLAARGDYDGAILMLNKSKGVRDFGENIRNEINLIREIAQLEQSYLELDIIKKEKLGNNLFLIMNFERCAQVFEDLIEVDERAEFYNNLASCQASSGQGDEARVNFEKALGLNPDLEKSKEGLEALNND